MPRGKGGKFRRDALIDLAGLQAAIEQGALGKDDVFLATRRCDRELQDLGWSMAQLLACIRCLQTADHRGAHWCENGSGTWYACDAYAIRYDEARCCRSPQGLEFYLKFSIDEEDALLLVLISTHLSR